MTFKLVYTVISGRAAKLSSAGCNSYGKGHIGPTLYAGVLLETT